MHDTLESESDALTTVDSILLDLRGTLRGARNRFDEDERRDLARAIRQRVANTCAQVDWILLDKLSRCDGEILQALVELEPERGVEFRTTGVEIWRRTPSASYSVVYVALRRLDYLGLITRSAGAGNQGTRVRINWGPA